MLRAYQSAPLAEAGIRIHELAFPDGEPPPRRIIEQWLLLVDEVFQVQPPPRGKDKEKRRTGQGGAGRGLRRGEGQVGVAAAPFTAADGRTGTHTAKFIIWCSGEVRGVCFCVFQCFPPPLFVSCGNG